MNRELLDEAEALIKKPNSEKRKFLVKIFNAVIDSYAEIEEHHKRQSLIYHNRGRELHVLLKAIDFREEVEDDGIRKSSSIET